MKHITALLIALSFIMLCLPSCKSKGGTVASDSLNNDKPASNDTTVSSENETAPSDVAELLDLVPSYADSSTCNSLPSSFGEYSLSWRSTRPNLYTIEDGVGMVVKEMQTHKAENAKIILTATDKDGTSYNLSKEIEIAPISFEPMSSSPVATYFQLSNLSLYKSNNQRYALEKSLFSDTSKNNLDILYIAFANIDSDGNVIFSIDMSLLNELKELRKNCTRLVLSIAGTSKEASLAFRSLTSNKSKRAKLVGNIMDTVEKYGLDGVDIDWESSPDAYVVAANMTALMRDLRTEMNARQSENGSPYLLTAAVPASSWGTGQDRFNFKQLNLYVDYINLMSYDLNHTSKATHLSPLYSSEIDGGYGFGCDYGVNRLTSLGLDKNKIIIGCAGYGKLYSINDSVTASTALGSNGILTKLDGLSGSYASGTLLGQAIDSLLTSDTFTQHIERDSDGNIVGSYLLSTDGNMFVTFDSAETVKEKYRYALENGVGIMCWSYTEDVSDRIIDSISSVIEENKQN